MLRNMMFYKIQQKNDIVLLNTIYQPHEIGKYLPNDFKENIFQTKTKVFIIDTNKIASDLGLGNYINFIMKMSFFKIKNFFPLAKEKKDIASFKKYFIQDEKIIN